MRSPALLALVADGTTAGIPLNEMLDLIDTLCAELTSLAAVIAGLFVERLLQPLEASRRLDDLLALLQRAAISCFKEPPASSPTGSPLPSSNAPATPKVARRGEQPSSNIRVGAVADSAGNIRYSTAR